MAYFAAITIVECDSADEFIDGAEIFVGEPWEVEPFDGDCFGTIEAIERQPMMSEFILRAVMAGIALSAEESR